MEIKKVYKINGDVAQKVFQIERFEQPGRAHTLTKGNVAVYAEERQTRVRRCRVFKSPRPQLD